jgi:D-glycero-D-manno-heptose 1,7-bisphosphate phosphatase
MAAETGVHRAVFLDRDGVINRKADEGSYVRRWSDFEFLPGALVALRRLRAAGASLFIVTNQRGVARGIVNALDLAEIHARMSQELQAAGAAVEGIYVCPHEADACSCRKPEVGLFLTAARDHPWISFPSADLIGDSLGDLEAGRRLGMRLWLVGDGERRAAIMRQSEEQGIELAGSALSLLALVESGKLLAALGQPAGQVS